MGSARQFLKFGAVGILNTGVDLAVLNAETLLSGVKEGAGYAVQKGLSFLAAVACSYLLNRHWTFRSEGESARGGRFGHFVGVSLIGALVNVVVATAVVTYGKDAADWLWAAHPSVRDQLWVNIGALCGTSVGFVWNFLGYKFVVFDA